LFFWFGYGIVKVAMLLPIFPAAYAQARMVVPLATVMGD
jgi:hypothetical protein